MGIDWVIAKATEVFGTSGVDVARASIVGQITVGFPISPLTPSTFLLIGLAGVELGDHVLGQVGRAEDAEPRDGLEALVARFGQQRLGLGQVGFSPGL